MIPVIGAASLALALIWWVRGQGEGQKPWALGLAKAGSTALLALIALLAGVNPWLTLGLVLGALGDFALTRGGQRAFLAGLVAFALGHLAYIPAFLYGFWPALSPGVTGVLVLALPLSTSFWLLPWTGAMRRPVQVYCGVIGGMALSAFCVPHGPAQLWLQTGAVLFVASDLLLALRLFRLENPQHKRLAALILWPLYYGAQVLILLGGLAAL